MLRLVRNIKEGKEVIGRLYLPDGTALWTLENKYELFNEGDYTLRLEYSPKFSTNLWEFKDIPGRTEIKFHRGTSVTNTKGCVLLRSEDLNHLHTALDNHNTYKIQVETI